VTTKRTQVATRPALMVLAAPRKKIIAGRAATATNSAFVLCTPELALGLWQMPSLMPSLTVPCSRQFDVRIVILFICINYEMFRNHSYWRYF